MVKCVDTVVTIGYTDHMVKRRWSITVIPAASKGSVGVVTQQPKAVKPSTFVAVKR